MYLLNHDSPTPNKTLIRISTLADKLDLSRSGLAKLRIKDPTFPKPIKDSDKRQAAAFFVVAEVEAWLKAKMEKRVQVEGSATTAGISSKMREC